MQEEVKQVPLMSGMSPKDFIMMTIEHLGNEIETVKKQRDHLISEMGIHINKLIDTRRMYMKILKKVKK